MRSYRLRIVGVLVLAVLGVAALVTPARAVGVQEVWVVSLRLQWADGMGGGSAYVTAEPNGNVLVNRRNLGPWERFDLISLESGRYALVAHSNRKCVAFEPSGRAVANRTSIGPWETFTYVRHLASYVRLKAYSNGKFATAVNGGGRELAAIRTSAGPHETFHRDDHGYRTRPAFTTACAR